MFRFIWLAALVGVLVTGAVAPGAASGERVIEGKYVNTHYSPFRCAQLSAPGDAIYWNGVCFTIQPGEQHVRMELRDDLGNPVPAEFVQYLNNNPLFEWVHWFCGTYEFSLKNPASSPADVRLRPSTSGDAHCGPASRSGELTIRIT